MEKCTKHRCAVQASIPHAETRQLPHSCPRDCPCPFPARQLLPGPRAPVQRCLAANPVERTPCTPLGLASFFQYHTCMIHSCSCKEQSFFHCCVVFWYISATQFVYSTINGCLGLVPVWGYHKACCCDSLSLLGKQNFCILQIFQLGWLHSSLIKAFCDS